MIGIKWPEINGVPFSLGLELNSLFLNIGQIHESIKNMKINLKLFTTALLAAGATAAWTAKCQGVCPGGCRIAVHRFHLPPSDACRRMCPVAG